MPAEMRETLQSLTRGGMGGALMLLGFLMSLIVNAIFGAIGGLLGTVMFKPASRRRRHPCPDLPTAAGRTRRSNPTAPKSKGRNARKGHNARHESADRT